VSGHSQPPSVQGPSKDSSAAAIVVGLWWSLEENPRSTSVTPLKGRKFL